jgi:hypothetical protein
MAVRRETRTPAQERASLRAALRADLRRYRAAQKDRADRGLPPLPLIAETIAEAEEALRAL